MEAALNTATQRPTVIRTERGLTIAGTRITLYQILDYLCAGWTREQIQRMHSLTDEQITDVLDYIEAHRTEVVAEYELVLRQAEESRRYWEERNQERLAEIARSPSAPGQEAIRAKLEEAKSRSGIDS
jgi:uncharacterized protein (DUF433 family)